MPFIISVCAKSIFFERTYCITGMCMYFLNSLLMYDLEYIRSSTRLSSVISCVMLLFMCMSIFSMKGLAFCFPKLAALFISIRSFASSPVKRV